MFDDVDRLRDNPHLAELLGHYANLGKENRALWQDRLMHWEGIDSKELSALHGELMVFDWIEQNTGQASAFKDGVISSCYRITLRGLRDLGQFQGVEIAQERSETAKSQPTFAKKKKQKSEAPETIELANAE
jgi:hypothetical protein